MAVDAGGCFGETALWLADVVDPSGLAGGQASVRSVAVDDLIVTMPDEETVIYAWVPDR